MALRPPDSSKPITPPDGSGVTLERSFLRFTDFVSAYAPQVSLGGMFVPSVEPPPPGTIVDLDFKLDDGYRLFQGVGEVVWVQIKGNQGAHTPGAGVRFHALDERGRELILKVLEDHVAVGGAPFELEPPPLGASRELDAVTLPSVSPTGANADDDLISAPALQDDTSIRRAPAAVTEASVEAEIDAAVGELDLQSIASPSQPAIMAEGPSTEVAAVAEQAAEEAPELDTAPASVVDSGLVPVMEPGMVSEAANGETVEAAEADWVESMLEPVEMAPDREVEVAETAPDLEIDLVAVESSDEIASLALPDPPPISDADLPDPPLTLEPLAGEPLAGEPVDSAFLPTEKTLAEAPSELFPGVEVAGSEASGELSIDLDLPASVLPEVELLDQAPPTVDRHGERFSDEVPSLEDVPSAEKAGRMASEASFASLIADEADRSAPTVRLEILPPVEPALETVPEKGPEKGFELEPVPDDREGVPAAAQARGGHSSLPPMDAIDRAVLEPVDADPSESTHPGVAEAAPISASPGLSTSEFDSVPRASESVTPSPQPVTEPGPAHQTTVDLSAFTPTPAILPPEISIPEMPQLAPPVAAPDSGAVTPAPAAAPIASSVALSEDAALSEEPVFDRAQYFEASRPKRRWPVWVLAAAAAAALAFFGYSWFNGSRTIGSGPGVVDDPVAAQGDARGETASEPNEGLESDSAIEQVTASEIPEQGPVSPGSETGLRDSVSGLEPQPSLATAGAPVTGDRDTGDRDTGSVARISSAPAASIREILWRETVDSTVVTLVGNGRLSPDRLRVLAMGGELPRVLLRIARVSLPYHSSRQAIDGRHVRAIRTGLHPETQELHIVLDLASDDVRLLADPVADADNRIRLTLGR